MNRITRFFLPLSLILAAPGLAPYQAAAQTISARVAAPAGPAAAAGASIHSLGGASAVLPSANLQAGLIPSLTPAPSLAPLPVAPAAAASPAAPRSISPATALKVPFTRAAAAAPAKAAAAPAAALAALKTGGVALTAAAEASADAPRVALDGLFEGSVARPESLAVAGLSAPSDSPRLAPSQGPRWVKSLRAPDAAPAPATSVKRTLNVGFLAAVIPIAITMVTVVVAQMLGYVLHPNYQGPDAGAAPTIISALALWIGAAVMAPISEEAIFRGGLQKKLSQLSAKIRLGTFVLPATVTSLIFVALHETSDPVLFTTRFVHAMILGWVYQKEGILSAMAAHGFFNGLLASSIVFSALGMPWLGIATIPVALFFAVRAAKSLRAQKYDRASGALIPKPLGASLAFIMAAILVLGYFFLMPNIFWAIGAVALAVKGIMMLQAKKA